MFTRKTAADLDLGGLDVLDRVMLLLRPRAGVHAGGGLRVSDTRFNFAYCCLARSLN